MRRRQAIAVLALAGCFVALYLWLYKLGVMGELRCGTGGCETVQASPYAELFGLPVALYGVAGYAALFLVSLAALQPAAAARRRPDVALAVLASIGFAFTLYLTALELFVIHAFCRWCLGSAAIITAVWILALAGVRRNT
ncbi:MAG: vitamin K epoxide reductase [Gemmatimonadetes bacterium]|nr:MAG: vitamin K epoxide reductase [Gemmatimonadota bacterium]